MITCLIHYEIEPTQKEAFERYAKVWGQVIPRCGGDLIGYFSPHEGTTTEAYALINLPSLAAYEAYRAHLRDDKEGMDNFRFAQRERFIRREDRQFYTLCSGPHGPLLRT